jgi:epoxyqueuosine reductase
MEKVWAVRAGLGFVGKNGCLITREYGSWVVLAAFVLDAAVSAYDDEATVDRCGSCRLCVEACPTEALSGDRSVDARACLAYQTIENVAPVPEALRPALEGLVFGCDICQAVCPLSNEPVRAGARFAPRPISTRSVEQLAALTRAEYDALVPGTPLARVQYDGLRRNAAYALGAAREPSVRPLLTALAQDSSAAVREAAQWALTQLP